MPRKQEASRVDKMWYNYVDVNKEHSSRVEMKNTAAVSLALVFLSLFICCTASDTYDSQNGAAGPGILPFAAAGIEGFLGTYRVIHAGTVIMPDFISDSLERPPKSMV